MLFSNAFNQIYSADSWQMTILRKQSDIFSLSVLFFKTTVFVATRIFWAFQYFDQLNRSHTHEHVRARTHTDTDTRTHTRTH